MFLGLLSLKRSREKHSVASWSSSPAPTERLRFLFARYCSKCSCHEIRGHFLCCIFFCYRTFSRGAKSSDLRRSSEKLRDVRCAEASRRWWHQQHLRGCRTSATGHHGAVFVSQGDPAYWRPDVVLPPDRDLVIRTSKVQTREQRLQLSGSFKISQDIRRQPAISRRRCFSSWNGPALPLRAARTVRA